MEDEADEYIEYIGCSRDGVEYNSDDWRMKPMNTLGTSVAAGTALSTTVMIGG